METKTYRVSGMTCGGCVKHVEKALRSVDGVTAVVVDLGQGTATVEGAVAAASLAASVTKAGYEWLGEA